jgi:hypothetical protein
MIFLELEEEFEQEYGYIRRVDLKIGTLNKGINIETD